jgi:Tol biopolymer transport system component
VNTIRHYAFAYECRVKLLLERDCAHRSNIIRMLAIYLAIGLVAGCGGSQFHPPTNNTPSNNTIAFESSRALNGSDALNSAGNIWLANADGSGPRPLTRRTDGSFDDELVWSPDGNRLAFLSSRPLDGGNGAANTAFNLWVINADGSGATPLTRLTNLNLSSYGLVWSPDGRKIVFNSNLALDGSDAVTANFTQNIWLANADGTGVKVLTRLDGTFAGASLSVWSQDGRKIAFMSGGAFDGSNTVGPTFNLWVMNADGSGATALTRFVNAANMQPVFSPDGTKLAFLSTRALDGGDVVPGASTNLWVAATDGSGATPLTRYTAGSAMVEGNGIFWSPDSKKIALTSSGALDGSDAVNTNSTDNVWLANADGSGATPLTRLSYPASSPPVHSGAFANGWSPDGANLAFVSDRALDGSNVPAPHRISSAWVMKGDGTNARPLSNLPLSNAGSISPAWKP